MSGDGRTARIEKEMRRRYQPQRLASNDDARMVHPRQAQRRRIKEYCVGELLDGGTDRTIDIAAEKLACSSARGLRLRESERLRSTLKCCEILGMEMAEADDELDKHCQQRQKIRRAARTAPPDNE
ncbi:MAG TPA: hypothetical protein VGF92_03745 [Stellaceae bacterium]|jgi:hypothetical protein